jgi:hypothetical protein
MLAGQQASLVQVAWIGSVIWLSGTVASVVSTFTIRCGGVMAAPSSSLSPVARVVSHVSVTWVL